jgi:hypothetical protein
MTLGIGGDRRAGGIKAEQLGIESHGLVSKGTSGHKAAESQDPK